MNHNNTLVKNGAGTITRSQQKRKDRETETRYCYTSFFRFKQGLKQSVIRRIQQAPYPQIHIIFVNSYFFGARLERQ